MAVTLPKPKIGFIPANRGFFSSALAAKMRKLVIEAMQAQGIEVVVPSDDQTKVGCVQSLQEAEVCAKLFRDADVDGILVGAVNFGEEQAVAHAVRKAGRDVPILIFGCEEEESLTMTTQRRDSFCGLLSIGEVLRQIGAKYTVAQRPIVHPSSEAFRQDLDWFVRVCRVVGGVRGARYGQVGARPDAFWTCRFDEKRLQRMDVTTVVLDLSEVFAGCAKLSDDDPKVVAIAESIAGYADVSKVRKESVLRSAKLELFLRRWKEEQGIDAMGIQCWTSIQANYGVCSCTTMSRLGDEGVPCACEADILGTLSMHALMLASGTPAALADWNNLHNDDDELANLWHCGVFPASFAKTRPKLGVQEIIASSGAARYEDSEGVVEFVSKPGAVTLARVNQNAEGEVKAVVVQGQVEDNPAHTFGAYGWCRIAGLQGLYRDVLLRHFPHHVALTQSHVGNAVYEAFGNYLGFDVYTVDRVDGRYCPKLPF